MKNSSVKKFFFKTCPKSGRIVGINRKNVWLKVVFPLICVAALVWFLIRVVPKPSRINYPCQQVAAPLALGVLTYIANFAGISIFYRKSLEMMRNNRYALSLCCIVALLGCAALFSARSASDLTAAIQKRTDVEWIPTDGPNQPIGDGKGIFPGRVVWAHDTTVSSWQGEFGEGKWWEDRRTFQDTVCRMMRDDIMALAGTESVAEAWNKIFLYHNSTLDGEKKGYVKGEKIAIKINCNNAYDGYTDRDNQIDASKQTVLALLRQLINDAGVEQSDIVVYEAVRVIPDRIYVPCNSEFPGVRWVDSKGNEQNGRSPVEWKKDVIKYSKPTECGTGIPTVVYESKYLVNLFLVKGHISVGLSLGAKNHYGTINGRDHKWKMPGEYHPFVDYMGSRRLGAKTVLYIADGIYGIRDVNDPVTKEYAQWNNTMNGNWMSSIFMSLDPVAIDAVCYDFLRAEFGARLGRGRGAPADTYMHEAALADNPPSGTIYTPNGERLKSLGVHEHWNNPQDRQYTKNLNPDSKKGIELFEVYR